MSATSSVAHAGMVLGSRYELIEPIASGGMAQVWRGQDLSLNRPGWLVETLLAFAIRPVATARRHSGKYGEMTPLR